MAAWTVCAAPLSLRLAAQRPDGRVGADCGAWCPVGIGLTPGGRTAGDLRAVRHHRPLAGLCRVWPQPHPGAGAGFSLAAMIAAVILPLAAGDPARTIASGGDAGNLSGLLLSWPGLARLDFITEAASKRIATAYMNGIALDSALSPSHHDDEFSFGSEL